MRQTVCRPGSTRTRWAAVEAHSAHQTRPPGWIWVGDPRERKQIQMRGKGKGAKKEERKEMRETEGERHKVSYRHFFHFQFCLLATTVSILRRQQTKRCTYRRHWRNIIVYRINILIAQWWENYILETSSFCISIKTARLTCRQAVYSFCWIVNNLYL